MNPRFPGWLQKLLKRPVAILGGGVSGRAAAGLIATLGGRFRVYDQNSEVPQRREFGPKEAAEHGLAVCSPGFASDHAWIRNAQAADCEVIGEMDLGALSWPGEIIAVTGTNGKTTVCNFISHALRLMGRDARPVGNIGSAFSDAWRRSADTDSVAVCEVSSFQAEALRFFEANATVWTNFAEDHLERHGTLESYFRAKSNLVKRTRDNRVFFGPSVAGKASELGLELRESGLVKFGETLAGDDRLASTVFEKVPQLENFELVRALWLDLGLSESKLFSAARTFRLAAHRLARTDEVRGVSFWNDSKATNFHAAEAALRGFADPVSWILGGRAKGGDIAGFIGRAAKHVRHAYVLGDTAAELESAFRAEAVPVTRCDSMRDAVNRAFSSATSGDNVVLSPGFASFDMFESYDDRGRQFEAAVAELAATHRVRHTASRSHTNNRLTAMGLSIL